MNTFLILQNYVLVHAHLVRYLVASVTITSSFSLFRAISHRRFPCAEQYHVIVFLVSSNITPLFSLCRAISRRFFPCVKQYHVVVFPMSNNMTPLFSLCRAISHRHFPCGEQYRAVVFLMIDVLLIFMDIAVLRMISNFSLMKEV